MTCETKRPSKIILIVLDTLRADHLGCYGYKRNTTPNIDLFIFSRESILFKYAFSPCSYTMPAHASIFTGKYPFKHSTGFSNGHPVRPLDGDLFLSEILSDIGYETAGFVSSIVLSRENGGGIKPGFKVYDDKMTGAELNRPEILIRAGKETNKAVFEWLKENSRNDFFLFINYFDIHGPYFNPEPYDSIFVRDKLYGEPMFIDKIVPDDKAVGGIPEYQVLKSLRDEKGRLIDFEKDLNYYISQYDGGIRCADDCVGSLVEELKRLGIYNDTLIILTSDHGEALGENNVWFFHGLTVTPDQIYVPLLIKPHEGFMVKRCDIETHVSLIDIFPTVCELAGFNYSNFEIDGRSLVKVIENGEDDELGARTFTSEIEGQIAYIDKDSIKVRQREFDKEKSVFYYIKELCNKESTMFYRKDIVFEHGKCFICGNKVDFQIEKGFSLREARCPICHGTKRSRDLAKVIVRTYIKDETLSLAEGLDYLKDLSIYEAGANGSIHDYLGKLPQYKCSEYFDNIPAGSISESGIRCENLERLTFPDNSFDLVVTQDVFEHISNPERAFLEIYRVLKPGGCHIFTIPFHESKKTVKRVHNEDGKKSFNLPPVYHSDPLRESGSLVYTDFGDNIIDYLKSIGIPTDIVVYERFYPPEVIPWINDESSYKAYMDYREKGEMLKYFLYNSVVFKSRKDERADMLKMGGERFLPWMDDAMINYEHLHRYRFATEFVKGRKVLDLACGEGYGSFMMSQEADEVIGVDLDEVTIRHAFSKYIKENLKFIKGSITDIPIEGEKIFDVIVCFEALEHIEEHDELMKEAKRLLKEDGTFIVSTPNKYVYSDKADYQNPYHLRELYFDEFKTLLNNNFKNTLIYGQKVYPSSNIFPLFKGSLTTKDYVIEKGDKGFLSVPPERKEARYFIAVSSDVPIIDISGNSYLVDVSETLFKQKDVHIGNLEAMVKEKDVHIGNLEAAMGNKDQHISHLEGVVRQKEAYIQHIHSGHGWRFLTKYYKIRDTLLPEGTTRRRLAKLTLRFPQLVNKLNISKGLYYIKNYGVQAFLEKTQNTFDASTTGPNDLYQLWIEKNEPKENELRKQKETKFPYELKISIVVPVFETPKQFLIDMVESVLNQTYPNWELCLADGGSTGPQVKEILEAYANSDARIKVKFLSENKGIAGNSNEALSLATGDFIALLDHDDTLAPFALFEVVKAINENPGCKFIYSDYVITDQAGKLQHAIFCPDFCRFYYISHPYFVHLVVFGKGIIDKVGGFDENDFNEGVSHDVDLFLRIFSLLEDENVIHIPKVLYFWKHHAKSSGHKFQDKVHKHTKIAIQRYLQRKSIDGWVEDGLVFNTFRFRPKIKNNPFVSIIIPTKDEWQLLNKCLKSLEKKGDYENYEIIIVKNNTEDEEAIRYLESLESEYKVLEYAQPFNYSAINNYAVKFAKGDSLLFLNDDIEFKERGGLWAMLELLQLEEVGIVGAKLLYPDETIQHSGVIIGLHGPAEHWHKFMKAYLNKSLTNPGYISSMASIREYSAVTGACLMIKRNVFEEISGFSEDLKVGYGDIDLCLKAGARSYKVLCTPYALAYHHESVSRRNKEDLLYHPEDREIFLEKWNELLSRGDPYYNPNLALNSYIPVPRVE